MYVVIEGGEGAGKTRLTKWLVEHFSSSGHAKVHSIREPPDSPLGKVAIDYFRKMFVDPRVAAYLMTAARIDMHQWIEASGGLDGGPNGFDDGLWISDRSFLSTFVYQSEVGTSTLLHMHGWTGENAWVQLPHLVIYLDVDPEEAVRRVRERGSEHLSDDQVRRFAERYRKVVDFFRQRWHAAGSGSDVGSLMIVTVDANRPFEVVAEEAQNLISQRLKFLSSLGGSA
jgi:dTMP kinase